MFNASQKIIHRLEQEIVAQKLPANFLNTVQKFYRPLASDVFAKTQNQTPLCIGIQGAQGSGKSTATAFLKLILEVEFGLTVFAMSLDDFYLSKAERDSLAQAEHPLLRTRGVPGTHDVELMHQVLDSVVSKRNFCSPVFDKSIDDRLPRGQWQENSAPIDVVLFEGWCVGLAQQKENELSLAMNDLERVEDPDCVWRKFVNTALAGDYAALFERVDEYVVLQAPSFDCVYAWRGLQEQKMIEALKRSGNDTSMAQTPMQIERFISHFQRLTQHSLATMPEKANWLFLLDDDHSIKRMLQPKRAS